MENTNTTPEQQEAKRKYAREAKQRSRERQKQERLALQIPAAFEYQLPRTKLDQLSENSRQITATIAAEITLTTEDERMVSMMADVLLGYEKQWTQQVHSPHAVLYAGHFSDAAASEVIEHVHRFPASLESQTFADLYQKFLKTACKLSRNTTWFDLNFAREIESEINGTYALPPAPKTDNG